MHKHLNVNKLRCQNGYLMSKLSKISDQQNDILIAFIMKKNIEKYRRNFHGLYLKLIRLCIKIQNILSQLRRLD